ncbi:MAG: 2-oxo acid dehydrogenase subunit E2, partial [Actinomycetota bacterium]|nr:2-oxo acid dehydrogenase subunit E2 [Actinomycetota bacterium]
MAGFGPNEWLVEEMYEQYVSSPDSVDEAWHEFFADYSPTGSASPGASDAPKPIPAVSNNGGTPPSSSATAPPKAATASDPSTAPAQKSDPPAATPKPTDSAAAAPGRQPDQAAVTPPASAGPPAPAGNPERAKLAPLARDRSQANSPAPQSPDGATSMKLRGAAARVVANMESSLEVPTATSVRAVPAKLIADNRIVINNHLRRSRGGKVSFTHLIGYALVKALESFPEMNNAFGLADGKPALITPQHVNLGLAIDLPKEDGSRQLVVASVKGCEAMDFAAFWSAYEEIIKRARSGKLTTDDFAGTTISLTNPGTLGTNHSVPRLMAGQGTILGVGAMEYPAEFQGMSEEMLAEIALSKTITLTSTYDHRIIQGAQSGDFLRRMH